jgi:hypothetical protein
VGDEPRNAAATRFVAHRQQGGSTMGRGCLLWALGVPLPIVLILWFLFFR